MSYQDWRVTVDPKIRGSWNLHTELPIGMDFFILLSSVMGILGSGSLSAYNAGNTYQDALARYRRLACGERATCLDVGAILDADYLSDALGQGHQVVVLGSKMFMRCRVDDILELVGMYYDSGTAAKSTSVDDSQIVVGLRPPGNWKHLEDVPFTMKQPFWGHMHQLVPPENEQGEGHGSASNPSGRKRIDLSEKLAAATSVAEAAAVVSEALAMRTAALLGVPPEEGGVGVQSPMESYGLDSLSAIHVRNWIGSVFDVDMPVFEILGGTTFC
jgi:hypothetical protein